MFAARGYSDVMHGRVRVTRGSVAGILATALALFFHVAAGAPMPGWLGVLVPLVASVFVAVILSRHRFSWVRLALSAVVAQWLFHHLFMLGAMPFDVAGSGHIHHDHGAVDGVAHGAYLDMHATHGGQWMWLAHLAAAVLTTVLVHRGEAVVQQLARWGALALRRLLARIPRPVLHDAAGVRLLSATHWLPEPGRGVPGDRCTRGPPGPSCYLLAS